MIHDLDLCEPFAWRRGLDSELTQELQPIGVCGTGASAGGLDPLAAFLESIPVGTGVAYVVVQHLSPNHESMMAELLGRRTSMPVRQADDGDILKANHVYVLGPGDVVTVEESHLAIEARATAEDGNRSPHPIDAFFFSLRGWSDRSAAIVLSGTGDDGTRGSKPYEMPAD